MASTGDVELVYDDTPPSLNAIGTRGSHWRVTAAKKRWGKIFDDLLLVAGRDLPRGCSRIRATGTLVFPRDRRRDEGNHRWLLEKALGDALVNAGRLSDDTGDHFQFGRVRFEKGPKRTIVRLRWWIDDE